MYKFNVEKTTNDLVQWIKDWFKNNGNGCNAVLGMSGGKDSTIAAALCIKALGADRVIGVMMPDVNQGLNEADKICEHLNIRCINFPIGNITDAIDKQGSISLTVEDDGSFMTEQAVQNIPPRVRITVLFAIAQTYNGRVVNTCNLSEDYVGYATLFGDSAGSFSPFGRLTVTEIYAIGDYLGIPSKWVHKTPDDGLPHSTSDEKKFGFSYTELDRHIRENIIPEGTCENNPNELKIDKIRRMYKNNKFKTEIIHIPAFEPDWYCLNT